MDEIDAIGKDAGFLKSEECFFLLAAQRIAVFLQFQDWKRKVNLAGVENEKC